MNKELLKKLIKYIFIILSIISIVVLFAFIFILLNLFGIIREYKYIKINDNNKEEIVLLLKGQKHNMFNTSKDFDLNQCIESVNRLEVEYMFPDGENYVIYCNNNKYFFSLDNTDFDLPNYLYENGKTSYRIRKR